MSGKDISIVFPCFNEGSVLNKSVEKIRNFLDSTKLNYEIIFVEDKSSDNTAFLIKQQVKKYKNFKAVYHKKNIGRGGSVRDGILISQGKIVGYLDIDLEITPSYILDMYNTLNNGYDVVVANRSHEFTVKSFFRNFLHFVYASFSKLVLELSVSDPNAGCKFFKRKKILPVLKKTVDEHWFWDTEIIKRSELANLRIKEVHVLYIQNKNKKSSVKVFSDTLHFLQRLFWLRKTLSMEEKK